MADTILRFDTAQCGKMSWNSYGYRSILICRETYTFGNGKAVGPFQIIVEDWAAPNDTRTYPLSAMSSPKVIRAWLDNLSANRDLLDRSEPVPIGHGKPVVIAANGPSLARNVGILGASEIPVMAVNGAYRYIAEKTGRMPDLFTTLDWLGRPQWIEGTNPPSTKAVIGWETAPLISRRDWHSVEVIGARQSSCWDSWVRLCWPKLLDVPRGRESTFSAVNWAFQKGANPIVLVGVDHAFTDGYLHAGEKHSTKEQAARSSDLLVREDVNGEPVHTDGLFYSADITLKAGIWFACDAGTDVVNCTEGGVLFFKTKPPAGFHVMPLRECFSDLKAGRWKERRAAGPQSGKAYTQDQINEFLKAAQEEEKTHARSDVSGEVPGTQSRDVPRRGRVEGRSEDCHAPTQDRRLQGLQVQHREAG